MNGNVSLASYTQATGHFENGEFAKAQHAVSACLQEIYANIHRFVLTENLQNIYGTKVSVIVVSHRSGLEVCEVGRGIEDFIRRPDVELIFVGNGPGATEGASGPYADKARLFGLPENIGCSAARNVGAYVARGAAFCFWTMMHRRALQILICLPAPVSSAGPWPCADALRRSPVPD